MKVHVHQVGNYPGTITLCRFMNTFYNNKLYFLKRLMLSYQRVYITTYSCGAILYIDITYDSLTHGINCYTECILEIGNNITKSIIPMQKLFHWILNDTVQHDCSLFIKYTRL